MSMHALTVIAEELSPEHLLAAVKHWVAKFEQEILHKDMGPSDRGAYEFDHDGKQTAVHWNPVATVNHMQPSGASEGPADEGGPTDPECSPVGPGGGIEPSDPVATAEAAAADPASTAADVAAAVAPDAA